MTERASPVPFSPWSAFAPWFARRWQQGEHVSMIGPTGSGKSTLANAILPARQFIVVCATKPKDRTLSRLIGRDGFHRVKAWPRAYRPRRAGDRVLLWPEFTGPESFDTQRAVFEDAFGHLFAAGGWTVNVDEVSFMADELGLGGWLKTFWTQGRSVGITLVAGTQRPAFVPLYMYDQASHLFLWGDNDERNLRRVGGLGGLSADLVRRTVAGLSAHQCLYVGTRDGVLIRTRVT